MGRPGPARGERTLFDLILSVLLAGIFFLSGGTKLVGVKRIVAQFERWRYGPSVRLAGGALEVTSAALLLVPNLTLYGVVVLLGVLATAVYTHTVREGIPKNAAGAAVLLVFVAVLGVLRGPSAADPGGTVYRAIFG